MYQKKFAIKFIRDNILYLVAGLLLSTLAILIIVPQKETYSQYIKIGDKKQKKVTTKKKNAETTKEDISPNIPKSIEAQLMDDKKSILVKWDVPTVPGVDYVLGRSNSIINTPEKALLAEGVGVFPSRIKSYVDKALPPGKYYYVIIEREAFAEKNIVLIPDRNYTTMPVIVPAIEKKEKVEEIVKPDPVTLIYAKKIDKGKVLVKWKKLDKQGIIYSVYRYTEPIKNELILSKAKKLAELVDENTYIDTSFDHPGKYYYAVTTKTNDLNENKVLIIEQNYTSKPVVIDEVSPKEIKDKSNIVFNLRITPQRNGVILKWEYSGPQDQVFFRIYKSKFPIYTPNDLNKASLLGEISGNLRLFFDPMDIEGNYYAITVYNKKTKKETKKIVWGQNSISFEKKEENTQKEEATQSITTTETRDQNILEKEEAEALSSILRNFYYKKRYQEALIRLEMLIKNLKTKKIKAKALFFLARSYYYTGYYRKALNIFMSKEVKSVFPLESEYWIEKTIGKIGR